MKKNTSVPLTFIAAMITSPLATAGDEFDISPIEREEPAEQTPEIETPRPSSDREIKVGFLVTDADFSTGFADDQNSVSADYDGDVELYLTLGFEHDLWLLPNASASLYRWYNYFDAPGETLPVSADTAQLVDLTLYYRLVRAGGFRIDLGATAKQFKGKIGFSDAEFNGHSARFEQTLFGAYVATYLDIPYTNFQVGAEYSAFGGDSPFQRQPCGVELHLQSRWRTETGGPDRLSSGGGRPE